MDKKETITRYAPSPTGKLHVGGARTALFAYLHAKSKNGKFLVRIEDTDTKRNIEGGEENQLNNLKWLGIEPDISPINESKMRQSERLDIYKKWVDFLLEKGYAYKCYCTSEELEKEREDQLSKGIKSPQYSKKCLSNPSIKDDYSVRLKVPTEGEVSWEDGVRGNITVPFSSIGDWVIMKSDGLPTYNFANVIDDHFMKVTDVHRGEEHISNTPKQIHLYQILGWEIPKFYHLTIIIGKNGKKLSKRDESTIQFIENYKQMGFLPESVFNFLSLLGWNPKSEEEIFSKENLINIFDEHNYSKSPSNYDYGKLIWFNQTYIKSSENILEKAKKFINEENLSNRSFKELFNISIESVEFLEQINERFNEILSFDKKDEFKRVIEDNLETIKYFIENLEKIDSNDLNLEKSKELIQLVADKFDIKGAKLLKPIRALISSKGSGPSLAELINILGKDEIKRRINDWKII